MKTKNTMKTKKITTFALCLLTLLFTMSVVSAGVDFQDLTGDSQSVDPDSQVTLTFALKEDGNGDFTDISLDPTITFSGCSTNFDAPLDISNLPNELEKNEKSDTITVKFNVPKSQKACSYTGTMVLRGKYSNSMVYPQTISLSVNSKPTLQISKPTSLTTSSPSTFTITNTGNTNLNPSIAIDEVMGISEDFTIKIDDESYEPNFLLNAGDSVTVEVSAQVPGGEEDFLEGKTTTITVTDDDIEETEILQIEGSYCEIGDIGDLRIKKVKFRNEKGFGDDEEWYLFDEIKVEVEIENDADFDIDDIVVEWGLYDKDNNEFLIEDEEDDFDLEESGEDDEKELTITFTVDADEFDEDFSESDFVFFIKAYSDEEDEDTQCTSYKEEDIRVKKDKDFVILNNIKISSDTIPCGEILEGTFDIWNIGSDDQEDVSVLIENTELEITEKIEIGDLDILDDKKSVPFSLTIPKDAEEKAYVLELKVLDEDDDVFENDEDDLSEFDSPVFNVEGNCLGEPADVTITAELDPETPTAIAGKQIIVKTVLENKGETDATYTLSVEGNSEWSELISPSPQAVVVKAGESEIVNIRLNINEDAQGDREFTINAVTEGKTTPQKVALSITKPEAQTTEITEHLRENWFIYLIIVVNIILIIAIIIVIRRMVSPAPPM